MSEPADLSPPDHPVAIVLPGSQWQERLIRVLQSRGFHVIAVNPVSSEATKIASEWLASDIFDLNHIKSSLRKRRPVLVTSDECEIAMEPVAELCRHFELPANNEETIRLFRNKSAIYQRANLLKIPTLETIPAKCADEVKDAINCLGFPVVVKPADSNSSQGVTFLHDEQNQWDFESIAAFSRSGEVCVQRYFPGRQFAVDGVVVNGTNHVCCIGEQFCDAPGVVSRVEYPASISADTWRRIEQIVCRYYSNSGLNSAISHAEVRVAGDDCRLLEIAMRGGGSATSSHIVPAVTSVDPYDWIPELYPEEPDHNFESIDFPTVSFGNWKMFVTNQFLNFDRGRVKNIADSLDEVPGLLLKKIWISVGDDIEPAENCKTRHGLIMVSGKDQAQVDERIEMARQKIVVEFA